MSTEYKYKSTCSQISASKRYYQKNKDSILEKMKLQKKEYYKRNKEKIKIYQKQYYKKQKQKTKSEI